MPCDHQEVVTEMGLLYNCKEKLPWILSKCFPFFCSFPPECLFYLCGREKITLSLSGSFDWPNYQEETLTRNIKFNLMPTGTPHKRESQRPHKPEKFRYTKGIEVCETS